MTDTSMIEKVARAIEAAMQQRPFGLYDYSNYPGDAAPHVVRDERTGAVIFRSRSRDEASSAFERLTSGFRARAAIAALREPTEGMKQAGNAWLGRDGPDFDDVWSDVIDHILTEGHR